MAVLDIKVSMIVKSHLASWEQLSQNQTRPYHAQPNEDDGPCKTGRGIGRGHQRVADHAGDERHHSKDGAALNEQEKAVHGRLGHLLGPSPPRSHFQRQQRDRRFDLAGVVYNGVQTARDGEGSMTGSVIYVVEIFDAPSGRLLSAFVSKQYPTPYDIQASVGSLAAAQAGIDKGADALVAQFR